MAGKSDAFESSWLQLLFNNQAITNIGDASGLRATGTAGSLYVSLHSADPGETGSAVTSEVTTTAYNTYARAAVARSTSGWTVSGTNPTQVANAAAINYTAMASGTGVTATYFGIVNTSSGAGVLLYSGQINSGAGLAISAGITPSFAIGALIVTED